MSHLETRARRARGGEVLEHPEAESRAWWTDVEHVRERIERRRALEARGASDADLDAELEFEPRFQPARVGGLEFEHESTRVREARALRESTAVRESRVHGARRSAGAASRAGGRRAVRMRSPAVAAPPALSDASGRRGGEDRRLPRPYAPPQPRPEVPPPRERPRPTISERLGTEPDRLAAWAFAFALLMVLVAATGHL
jgi:hypothetical protein